MQCQQGVFHARRQVVQFVGLLQCVAKQLLRRPIDLLMHVGVDRAEAGASHPTNPQRLRVGCRRTGASGQHLEQQARIFDMVGDGAYVVETR